MSIFYISIQTLLTTFSLNNIFLNSAVIYYFTSHWMFWLSSIKCLMILYSVTAKTLIFGLQNNLAVVHPLLILLIYSCLLALLGITKLKYISKHIWISVYVLFVTLFLGGWWAFQEFNWGGWWNWDGIETPIFITTIFITYIILHKFLWNNNTLINQWYFNKYLLYALVLIILLPRFGNTNSIHSFISLNTNYLYYISHILNSSVRYISYQICILNSNFATFFFIKILCLIILCIWISMILLKNFTYKTHTSHKIIYISIILGLCLNIKPIVFLSYENCALGYNGSLVNNHFFKNDYLFWVKPQTTCLHNIFKILNVFLN